MAERLADVKRGAWVEGDILRCARNDAAAGQKETSKEPLRFVRPRVSAESSAFASASTVPFGRARLTELLGGILIISQSLQDVKDGETPGEERSGWNYFADRDEPGTSSNKLAFPPILCQDTSSCFKMARKGRLR